MSEFDKKMPMTERLIMSVDLPGLPPIPTNGSHGHWAKKAAARKKWKSMAMEYIAYHILNALSGTKLPLEKAKLVLIRRSSVMGDADNSVASFKPIVDALVSMKVLKDDNWNVIGQPELRLEKAPPGKGSISVEVWA